MSAIGIFIVGCFVFSDHGVRRRDGRRLAMIKFEVEQNPRHKAKVDEKQLEKRFPLRLKY